MTEQELNQQLNKIVLQAIDHTPVERVAQILRGLANVIEAVAKRPAD